MIYDKLFSFPMLKKGLVKGYDNDDLQMPNKIIEMGLLPETQFVIKHKAPFHGPFYIEYGAEKTKLALREEEAKFIIVKPLENAD